MNTAAFNTIQFDGSGLYNPALFLPYALTVTALAADLDPWGIDPGQTTPILGIDTNPFGIDPGQTVALPTAADLDPWGIDPGQTTPITTGLDLGA